MLTIRLTVAITAMLVVMAGQVQAGVISWTDWTHGNPEAGTASGTITTATSTVGVQYNKPNGYNFLQTDIGPDNFDYFAQGRAGLSGRNPATSPYTSSVVENIPTAGEMISLFRMGNQTLTFSETIANPVFSYVSLNGYGYAFDRDFEILSFGDPDGEMEGGFANDQGYFGTGTSSKNVVDLHGGNFEYQLLGTGEPHGTIRFLGAFNTVSWRSLNGELWNGFTVGVQGTAREVFGTVPEPTSLVLWSLGTVGMGFARRRRS